MMVENERVSPPGRLVLPADGSLRAGLITAFAAILAYAGAQDPAVNPALALHEYRKAVRRARALLRLMDGVVGIDAHDQLASTLREVHRASSALRDRQVVLDVIQAAGPCASAPTDAPNATSVAAPEAATVAATAAAPGAETVAAILAGSLGPGKPAEAAPSAAAIAEVMASGNARLAPLPGLLAGAVPRRVRWEAVTDGLARSFRRARRCLHAAEQHGDDPSLHSLRKRIKELNYQVELFAGLGGGRVHRQRKKLSELAERLGQLADLVVLRGYAQTHLAPTGDQARLIDAIADERAGQLDQALAHAAAVLDRQPRSFARKIVRAARKHRA